MATISASKAIATQDIADKARRDLLRILESVRGKKNLVIERSLAGTIGLFVKFSTLQEYGVDKLFFLENHNVDSSQRNLIFLVRGENSKQVRLVAGKSALAKHTTLEHNPPFGSEQNLRDASGLTEVEQIHLVRSESKIDHDFTVIWVPRRTLVSNSILEEHGVLGEANITEFELQFLPLESDLLSLELPDTIRELSLQKDPTCIFAAAKALMLLQKQYGLFPRILGKGDNAKRLADLLLRMRNEEDVNASSDPASTYLTSFGLTPSSVVENLIIIDREIDLPTVLATQLTYEGLLDEMFGVLNNQTEVDSSVLGSTPTAGQKQPQNDSTTTATVTAATKRKVVLDSTDKLYPALRNANFATIGPLLSNTARRLQGEEQSIQRRDQSIAELRDAVKQLPSYQAESTSLKIHTSLAEEVTKFIRGDIFRRTLEVEQSLLAGGDASSMHDNIDELISRAVPLPTVLRLLALESCLSNGIRQRDLEHFKRQILHAYGFQHMLTLASMEKMGLIVPRESHKGYLNPIAGTAGQTSTDWNAVRRALSLWLDEIEESDPNDIAYVFSGYAPLSVRLVQCVLQKSHLQDLATVTRSNGATKPEPRSTASGSGWTGFTDTLSKIRGATVDVSQKGADADASHARKTLQGSKEGPRTSVVFFLGGITYAEIAALRFVSKQLEEKSGRKLVIATTGVINGGKMVGAGIEQREFGS
nr:vacuolar protein sorting-associated protein 33a [Quercus suber]